jgi:hypothetical protein
MTSAISANARSTSVAIIVPNKQKVEEKGRLASMERRPIREIDAPHFGYDDLSFKYCLAQEGFCRPDTINSCATTYA